MSISQFLLHSLLGRRQVTRLSLGSSSTGAQPSAEFTQKQRKARKKRNKISKASRRVNRS